MGRQLFTNNAQSQLSGTLPQGGTTLVVQTGHGSRFPTPTGGDFFYLTLYTKDAYATEQTVEIVKVTARAADVLTIERDVEGITGQAGGYAYDGSVTPVYIELRWTAGSANNTLQQGDIGVTVQPKDADLDWLATNISSAGKAILDDADAAAQRTTLGLGNVNNTSDANKPISTATQTALNAKLNSSNPSATGSFSITSNSASDAVRITQTGSGNALVVEDSASSDSTPFVIDATGNVIIGHTVATSGAYGDHATLLNIGAGYIVRQFNQVYSADEFAPVIELGKSRNPSAGAHTIVASGDQLGTIRFAGSDGTAFREAARIQALVDNTPGTNDMPGRLVFSTTADGASTPTERLRIDSNGNFWAGTGGSTEVVFVIGPQSNPGYIYGNTSETGLYCPNGAQLALDKRSTNGSATLRANGAVGEINLQTNNITRLSIKGNGCIYSIGSSCSNVVAMAALDVDCSTGNYFTKTIAANSTFTFSNAPAGAYAFTLELTHTSGTITWPASVKWPGDTAPTLTTGKTHLFTFVTDDSGVRWRGVSNVNYTN